MTSICLIADTHGRHRALDLPACDLLIHCGDFSSFQKEEAAVLADVDDWFRAAPATHVVATGGNHDFLLHRQEFRFAHAEFLEDRLIEIDGLSIYGSPWCPDLPGFAYHATEEELIERWRRVPAGVDILVTHTPPHGILDLPSAGSPHLGCPHLRAALERIQPRLHVFGHVHASHGQWASPTTEFINAAVVGGPDFELRHGPTTVRIATL